MASVRNKTAEIAEGRGGVVKKTLALLSRSFFGLTASPQLMLQELSGYLTAWHGCCSGDGLGTAGLRWQTHPAGHGLMFYRQVIGNSSEVYRQCVAGDCDLIHASRIS
ncbi:MAG: hypothetical protein J7J06_06985 [Methanosarcinales archaeon]|nr:hypothetical protein [Methanosarcinales archaeon]